MKDTKHLGTVTEAKVAAALLKRGKTVLTPMGDCERYDLVFTSGGRTSDDFQRVQCKTGRTNKYGNILFDNRSCSTNGKNRLDYRGQIECFGVYYPVNDKCYLVPIAHCGVRTTTLTLKRVPNSRGLEAEEYEL